MTAAARIDANLLDSFCRQALERVGLSADAAREVSHALVSTDAMGVSTHGTKLLFGYLKKLKGGGYRSQAEPKIERSGPSWALIDGDSGLGQLGSLFAIRKGMELASQTGLAYVGLRNTGHIGAAGHYAALAAQQGFVAMVTGNDIPSVAAPGSRGAVLGSNPLAYAIPTSSGQPILLDIATAAVAGGKVYAAMGRGETLPSTWLIDSDGNPTNDGSLYPEKASLAPMAGHKGYGLGLWCELMSAVIPGGHMTWEVGSWMFDPPSQPSWHNASFTLWHLSSLGPIEVFYERLDRLIEQLHQAPTAAHCEQILLPGELEWRRRKESELRGIELPGDVIDRLELAADFVGLPKLVFN
jgi:ureidoglycolate dehydrogenase (NAD+)